ncbi:MAG: DUF4402 domain-containing protein [Algoriphagus sp.]|uniref:DUF4402 domain-containing protein n=1 Tax=Algoriphagus sp. TaxID=1872435 RepID=UPI00261A9DCC|nr:DUF4402 domain-containing protein [Algoriphagus sp.]MDG1277134.1 DUF4402 domain-containing protein [Algoriphagus sp.]
MKKTVKILIAAVFALGFVSLAKAQSASISANATVISELSVTKGKDLNFGTIVVGQTKSIDAYDNISVSDGPELGSATAGTFTVNAQKGSNVKVSFILPTNLTSSTSNLLPISFNYGDTQVAAVMDDEGNYTEFYPTSDFQINGFNQSVVDPLASSVKFYIGGQVDATGVTAGTYTGTITLSATYN